MSALNVLVRYTDVLRRFLYSILAGTIDISLAEMRTERRWYPSVLSETIPGDLCCAFFSSLLRSQSKGPTYSTRGNKDLMQNKEGKWSEVGCIPQDVDSVFPFLTLWTIFSAIFSFSSHITTPMYTFCNALFHSWGCRITILKRSFQVVMIQDRYRKKWSMTIYYVPIKKPRGQTHPS